MEEGNLRVLIIRLSSIGDVILTTPVLKELKKKYPNIIIDFIVMDKFKGAIEGCPYMDNLIIFNKKDDDGIFNIIEFAKKLKKNNYTHVIDLHGKLRSIIISKIIGGNVYKYRKRSWWKTLLVKLRIIKYTVDDTIVKNYFGAVKKLGVEYKGEDLNFAFSRVDLENIPEEYRGHVVFAPGASKNTKKWCVENFGELAKLIYEKYGEKVLIIGGNEDYEAAEKIDSISGGNCVNLCGTLNLKESGALLSKSEYLVTNDSGPFHIARGVKCKSYVIFGPTSPGMFEFQKNEKLIYSGEKCSPCSLHGDKKCPKGHFNCMKKITGKDVFDIIEKNKGV